jgi:LmbE family N-acetylglucosaminyl deacetylase
MNIVLSPHFDDAVLSLGGLLAREASDTLVATFFAGTPPAPLAHRWWDTACGFTDSTEAIRERTAENVRSLRSFGLSDSRIRNYPHLDAQYRFADGKGAAEAPEPELEASIKEEIGSLIREHADGPIKVLAPGFEGHTDHAVMKRAALSAARAVTRGHAVEFFFYQDLPYALSTLRKRTRRTIREFLARGSTREPDYSALEQAITGGAFSVEPHIIPLAAADMEKKLAGIRIYASQVDQLHKQLLESIAAFAAGEARFFSAETPYCEVAYRLT